MSLFGKYEDRKENRMETGKADNVNNRQALLAEMLGVMARLGNDHGPSSSDAESHRAAEAAGEADEEWLSVQAACDYVHVSRTTMHRLVREGKLPYRVVCEGVETREQAGFLREAGLRRGARLLLRPPAAFRRVRSVGVPGGVGAVGYRGRQKDSQTANRRPARSSVRTAENAEWRRR